MKRINRKEPSKFSMIFTALSGVSLGVLGGAYLMLMLPAKTVARTPGEDILSKPGNYNTFYVSGQTGSAETVSMKTALARIERRSPGPVSFSEEEVNFFLERLFDESKSKEEDGSEGEQEKGAISFGRINVNLSGDQMFMSIKAKWGTLDVLAQSKVSFENTEQGPVFKVHSLRLNSLPVPMLGGLVSSKIVSKIEAIEFSEENLTRWKNIKEIELESDKLITIVGLRRG